MYNTEILSRNMVSWKVSSEASVEISAGNFREINS